MRVLRQLEVLGVAIVALLVTAVAPAPSHAACRHGASISKTCQSPRRQCTTDAFCDDANPCTDDHCNLAESNVTDCLITLGDADTCGDTLQVNEGFDVQDFGGDNVRVPAVGSLPVDSVDDNAVCCPGPSVPCLVGPAGSTFSTTVMCGGSPTVLTLPGLGTAGSVTFRQNTYVIQTNDPDPLPDQGNVRVQDLCNAGASGCSTGV